jgi:hypothetical protein
VLTKHSAPPKNNTKEVSMKLFWGTLLILAGSQLLINTIFGINLPLLRIVFGCLIIYLGLCLACDVKPWRSSTYRWEKKQYQQSYSNDQSSYSVTFATQFFDFSDLDPATQTEKTTNTLFGTTYITLDRTMPMLINTNATFANIILPDKTQIKHGESKPFRNYFDSRAPLLILNVNAVFGTVIISYA